jgi:nitronate monooxygenase
MRPSLERAGIDPTGENNSSIDFSGNIATANKAWKHVWSAGQGVGQITRTSSVAELVAELSFEFLASTAR